MDSGLAVAQCGQVIMDSRIMFRPKASSRCPRPRSDGEDGRLEIAGGAVVANGAAEPADDFVGVRPDQMRAENGPAVHAYLGCARLRYRPKAINPRHTMSAGITT